MALGISYLPTQAAQQQTPEGQAQETAPALQQALQMLSLRVPRFGGPNAILPDPLLQRQPGQPLPPQPGTPEWDELMRRLRYGQPGAPPQPGGAPMPPPLPAPGPTFKYPAPMPAPGQPVPPPRLPTWPGPGQGRSPFPDGRRIVPDKGMPDDRQMY